MRIFSNDISIKFGIEKCTVFVLKRKLAQTEGITLLGVAIIRAMEESEGYKYLGVLEASDMLHDQMKDKIRKEYLRRVKKVGGTVET